MVCAVVGMACSSMHLVHVPVLARGHPTPRPTDVVFTDYVPHVERDYSLVNDLGDVMINMTQDIQTLNLSGGSRFTVFHTNHVSIPSCFDLSTS